MVERIQQTLREKKAARWTALGIVAFTMLCGYYLTDVMSPLKPMLEKQLLWNSNEYGNFTSAYGWFNVFLFMLIFGGMILDKMGVRFTGMGAAIIMVIGTAIKYWAISTNVLDNQVWHILWFDMKAQVAVAALGYAIFGVGVEVAGITVSKIIVKWFKGKEMALAMGLEMATARVGTALALATSQPLAEAMGHVSKPILLCLIMLCIGLIAFFIYTFMDKKLDASVPVEDRVSDEDSFKVSDIKVIFFNKGWWLLALLCVLFYSAVFPFLKYATDLMVNKFGISEEWAGTIPALLPFGTMVLTPFFGNLYDRKGKGATIMIIGAILIILCHTIFSIPGLNHFIVAILMIIVLGIGFSLVPSAMWPSVPKIIPEKQLGTAYAMIFWVQNVGLMGVPKLIGWVLNKYCFLGYFTIVGSGFSVQHGEQITQVHVEGSSLYEVMQPGLISEKDSLFKVAQFEKNMEGKFTYILLENGDKVPVDQMDEDALKKAEETGVITITSYLYEGKGHINEFKTAAGQSISKFSNVTPSYNYTLPMMIFAGFGILALLLGFMLKAEDRKKGYGLELPNIQK